MSVSKALQLLPPEPIQLDPSPLPTRGRHIPAIPWRPPLCDEPQSTPHPTELAHHFSTISSLKLLLSLCIFLYLSESLRQLCVFKKIERSSIPWRCQLTIGSNLSIEILAYKSVSGRYTIFKKKCYLQANMLT